MRINLGQQLIQVDMIDKSANLGSSGDEQMLTLLEKFTYQYFLENRYMISESNPYEALCNNGYIKLYTKKGRVYWHTQNQFGHEVADWKFHVSINHQDLAKAWNLLAALFIKMDCRSGMKVIYLKEASPEPGREITIYILKYDDKFQKSQFADDFGLSIADQHSEDYWTFLIKRVESYLDYYQIRSNGLAQGDLQIGKYVSLRNEAYVVDQSNPNSYIYPPNSYGWNAAKHTPPLDVRKLQKQLGVVEEEKSLLGSDWKDIAKVVAVGATILTIVLINKKIWKF